LRFKVDKAIYGKSETKGSISNIVSHVTRRYKFASLPELNAVLRQYNVVADRGREGMKMFEKNGLVYSLLDDHGLKIGVPIKASALSTKPTLKYLEKQFELNKILREPHKDRLAKIIDSFFHATRNHIKVNFCDYMKSYDIEALFRKGKEGRVYGLTFIDHKKGVVLNGSDLGKGYSGQALIQKLQDDKTGEKEKIDVGNRVHLWEANNNRQADWTIGIPSTILSLMKAEKVYPGRNFHSKRKRKKKKRPSL
jgi:hypothetical protein